MLTISQLATYAGVTVRAVRWYHQRGLLREPPRDASGYRRYGAQDVIDLVRIATLAGAGVPLARVAELLVANADAFTEAVAEVDARLAEQIAALQRRRADLASLPSTERLCIPDEVADLLDHYREIGISERTIRLEREGWILLAAAYPELVPEMLAWKRTTSGDPEYQRILLLIDAAYEWPADDPRLRELAEECVTVMARIYPPEAATQELDGWTADPARYQLVAEHGTENSPGWARLNQLVEELARDRGYPSV